MEQIRHELKGHRIPAYVEEILIQNYCSGFMRMSMVREHDNYRFSYSPGAFRALDCNNMSLYEKLVLIKSLISVIEKNKEHLINPETYLIEPELVFTKDRKVSERDVRIMYYPDIKSLSCRYKLVLFADRILDKGIKEESDALDMLRQASEQGDINRIKMTMDKLIMRYENRLTEGRIFS